MSYLCKALLLGIVGLAFVAGGTAIAADKTLTIALKEKLDTLDVFVSALEEPLRVVGMVCETLVVYDPQLHIQPLLAKSWETSSDGLTWTFHLKEGIKFHDGTPFNAETYRQYLTDWFFPKSFNGWEFEPVKEVNVKNEYDIEFVLDRPFPMLLKYLADPWNIIESPAAREKFGDRYGFDALVGTGPFMFQSWTRGDRIILVRNPEYRHGPAFLNNTGPAKVERVVFREIPEPITRVSELRFGEVDLTRTVPENMLPEIERDPSIQVFTRPSFRVIYLLCNMERPLMQDQRIREAINHAIDRTAILNAAFHGYGSIAYSLLPPGATGYWAGSESFGKNFLFFDPELSKSLLEEAGWLLPPGQKVREKGGERLVLNLVTFNVPRYSLPAEVIQAMLSEVGIEVGLEIFDAAAANARLEAGEFDIAVSGWAYNLGEVTLDLIVGSQSIPNPNYARYRSPEIDEALEKVRLGQTEEDRAEAAAEVQRRVIEDQIVIPLVVQADSLAAKARVGGLEKVTQHPWWPELVLALEAYIKE